MEGLAYEALHDALVVLGNAQDDHFAAVQRMAESVARRFQEEERIVSELRDNLHALANRVEALTRAVA